MLLILGCLPLMARAADPLPALGADLSQTSVSGISSGGFMAAQLATAYSGSFIGVGIIAAGPYYCAGTYPQMSLLINAMTTCMSPPIAAVGPDAAVSLSNARGFAFRDRIDPVANLARQRVYVFSGTNDRTVKTIVVDTVPQYYRLAGTPDANIVYRNDVDAGHSIIVNTEGAVACSDTRSPYINNCGFEQSQQLLAHIYSASAAPAEQARGQVVRFDQRAFVNGSRSSMDSTAYVYVPPDCRDGGCKVHVALHGCQQGAAVIGDRFYNGTGYNQFADANRLIVLYPQVAPSNGIPANPKGCWDFWGYSDTNPQQSAFFTRDAPQMAAIVAMVRQLGQPVAATTP
jgi:poly(3-hydroxybutyrate) depolymerase